MCRHETRAISSRGGEDKQNSAIESAQERNTRLALEDEYFHLEAEIRRLDAIKATRWQQLVMLNQWDSHECDATVISLNEEIEQNRHKQLKVYTLLNENKRKIGERDRGMGKLMSMVAGKESVETQSEEVIGSAEGTMGWKRTYRGLSKGIRGEIISGVGLKELLESERRKKREEK